MSYSGTVTCSWCYEVGHNLRGCDKYKAHLKTQIEEAKEDGRDFRAKHYKRLLDEITTRTCSYCKSSYGVDDPERHTKAKCPTRIRNFEIETKDCLSARKALLKRWDEIGFGIGALLSIKVYCRDIWDYKNVTALVTDVDWQEITNRSVENHYYNDKPVVTVCYHGNDGKEVKQRVSLPARATWFTDASLEYALQTSKIEESFHAGCHVDILSGVHCMVPEDFLDAKQIKKSVKPYVDEVLGA